MNFEEDAERSVPPGSCPINPKVELIKACNSLLWP